MNYTQISKKELIAIYRNSNKRRKREILNSDIDIDTFIVEFTPEEIQQMLMLSPDIANKILAVMQNRMENFKNPIGENLIMQSDEKKVISEISENCDMYIKPKLTFWQRIIQWGQDKVGNLNGAKLLQAPTISSDILKKSIETVLEYQTQEENKKRDNIEELMEATENKLKQQFEKISRSYLAKNYRNKQELIEKYQKKVEPEKHDLVDLAIGIDSCISSGKPIGDIKKVSDFKISGETVYPGDVYLVEDLEESQGKNKYFKVYEKNSETGEWEYRGSLKQGEDGTSRANLKQYIKNGKPYGVIKGEGSYQRPFDSSLISYNEEAELKETEFTKLIAMEGIKEECKGNLQELKLLSNGMLFAVSINAQNGKEYSIVDGNVIKCKSEVFGTLNVPDNGEIKKASIKASGNLENYAVVLDPDGKERVVRKVSNKSAYPLRSKTIYKNNRTFVRINEEEVKRDIIKDRETSENKYSIENER